MNTGPLLEPSLTLKKIINVVCLFCGTQRTGLDTGEECHNCGSYLQKVIVREVHLEKRRPFGTDARQVEPI